MFQMLGVFAEFERAMIRERVMAGLTRARAEGKQLGRRTVEQSHGAKVKAALKLRSRSIGIRRIARVQQARELSAPVFGWFTEGFDTRDLKEAKALLEEFAP
jgi:DNA invertase Pin-like site-specific DNA recombinase